MNNKNTILIATVALLIFTTAVYFLYPAQIVEYQMDVKVQGPTKIGVNTGTDALHFGIVPIGSNAKRTILIENSEGSRLVEISKTGEMADWVSILENNFILKQNTNKTINFITKIPKEAEQGNYTGSIIIRFYRR